MHSSPTADQPPGGGRGEHQADQRGGAEGGERGRLDRRAGWPPRCRPAAADRPGRRRCRGCRRSSRWRSSRRPGAAARRASASSAFHHTASSLPQRDRRSRRARGTTAAGSVRGRAPADPLALGVAMARDCCQAAGSRHRLGRREQPATRLRHRRGDPRAAARLGRRARPRAAGDRDLRLDRASPKRVVLSRDAMRASALATQERLGGPGQWVLNLPPTYVAGVQVLYRSVVAGTEPVHLDRRTSRLRGRRGPTYVSLVPTQLLPAARARTRTRSRRWPRFDAVLIGGGPLAPAVRARGRGARDPDRADLRDERDLRRLRLRRAAARRRRGADRRRRRGAAARAGALRRLRGRARAHRRGPRGRLVPHRRPRAARRGRPAAGDRPRRRRDHQRRREGAGARRWPRDDRDRRRRACGRRGARRARRGVGASASCRGRRPRTLDCHLASVRDLVEPRAWAPRQLVLGRASSRCWPTASPTASRCGRWRLAR